MDTANDNPLRRFSSFWLGLLLFGVFGLVGLLLGAWFNRPYENAHDQANAERRAQIKEEVDAAQSGAAVAAVAGFEKVAKELLAAEAAPVKKDNFLLPGSDAQVAKAAAGAPGIEVPADFPQVAADAPVEDSVMELGKTQYNTCFACHGPTGEGMPNLGPPLAGSEWVLGPVPNLIAIQLRGLTGPIDVKGQTYTPVAPMPPQAFQTDEQIAAVITYVRNSFGNKASPVTPEQVAALRGEVGKPMLTQADLLPPTEGAGAAEPAPDAPAEADDQTQTN